MAAPPMAAMIHSTSDASCTSDGRDGHSTSDATSDGRDGHSTSDASSDGHDGHSTSDASSTSDGRDDPHCSWAISALSGTIVWRPSVADLDSRPWLPGALTIAPPRDGTWNCHPDWHHERFSDDEFELRCANIVESGITARMELPPLPEPEDLEHDRSTILIGIWLFVDDDSFVHLLNDVALCKWRALGWFYHISIASVAPDSSMYSEARVLWDSLRSEWNGSEYWFDVTKVTFQGVAIINPHTWLLRDERVARLRKLGPYACRDYHVSL